MEQVFEVRYYECDMQRVVHNAVYLAWCDDVADKFFRAAGAGLQDDWWDVMVKAASLTWSSSARLGDAVAITTAVERWGNTSFDVGFHGTSKGEPVFDATITYVAVRTGTAETVPVPDEFRAAFEGA